MLRKRSLWYAMFGACMALTMALSACGPTSTGGNTAGQPKSGGTVTDGLFEEPDNLLVGQSNETYSNLVDATIWAPLIYTDSQGLLQPGLLTQIPTPSNGGISSDSKTYTFKLRPNLKWSDGSPLTSKDVAFTINLLKNKDYAQKTGFEGDEVASVTTPDDSTTVVQLNKVDVAFLSFSMTDPLDFAPMPQKVFGAMAVKDIPKSPEAFKPSVSSGPFTVTDRQKADHITVSKNPNYYQAGKPYLDKVIFRIIPDQNTILTALQSGSIDTSWFLDVNNLDTYKGISGYKVYLDKAPGSYEMIIFNLYSSTNHILEDPLVRQAYTKAVNIDPVRGTIWKGIAVPTCDDAPATFAHATDLIPCYKQDAAAAKQLLDQAGWTMGSDGYRHKNGVTLETRYSTTQSKAYRVQTEQIIQQQLKDVGWKVDIVNYPADTYFGTVLPGGNYDIGEFASNPTSGDPDDHATWDCDQFASQNWSHWCNQTATTADKAALSNPDQTFRKQQYHILYEQIQKDVPAMFYYAFPNISIASTKVQNYAPGPFGPSETVGVWNWWRTDAKGS